MLLQCQHSLCLASRAPRSAYPRHTHRLSDQSVGARAGNQPLAMLGGGILSGVMGRVCARVPAVAEWALLQTGAKTTLCRPGC